MVAVATNTSEPNIWDSLCAFPKLHSRAREAETACCAEFTFTKSLERIEIPLGIYDSCIGLGLLSKDPIGFAAGDANLYRMTGNHPNMATDPSGLAEPGSVPNGAIISTLPMYDEVDEYIAREQAKLAQRTNIPSKRLRDLGVAASEAHLYENVKDEALEFYHWLHAVEKESIERSEYMRRRGHELDMLMLKNVFKTVGGGIETAAGGGLVVGGGFVTPIAATGYVVGTHGVDTTVSGVRGLLSQSEVDTMTSQGLQYVGMHRDDANWIDFGLGFVGTVGAGFLRQQALATVRLAAPKGPLTAIDEAKSLGSMAGKSNADIAVQMKAAGYSPITGNNGGTIWTKSLPDGNTSAVRVDTAMVRVKPKGFADEVPHVHKEIVPTNKVANGNYKPADATKLDDHGLPSTDPGKTHIPGGH